MNNLLALKVPGESNQPQDLVPPSNVPTALQGGVSSTMSLVQLGIQLLFLAGVIISVIVFMIAGIQWIASGGDSVKLASAKRRLFFAIIGVILMSGAFFLVQLIISILGGDPNSFMNPQKYLQ